MLEKFLELCWRNSKVPTESNWRKLKDCPEYSQKLHGRSQRFYRDSLDCPDKPWKAPRESMNKAKRAYGDLLENVRECLKTSRRKLEERLRIPGEPRSKLETSQKFPGIFHYYILRSLRAPQNPDCKCQL